MSADAPQPSSASGERAVENYNTVVAKAELSFVRLVDVAFKVAPNPEANIKKPPSLYCNVADVEFDIEVDQGRAGLLVLCTAGAKRGKAKHIDCKVRYFVLYSGLEGCEEEAVMRFLTRVGKFAVYPYFRSLFSTLTWEAQVGLPPLPVLKEQPRPRKPHSIPEEK